jgi:hypothetical protein
MTLFFSGLRGSFFEELRGLFLGKRGPFFCGNDSVDKAKVDAA